MLFRKGKELRKAIAEYAAESRELNKELDSLEEAIRAFKGPGKRALISELNATKKAIGLDEPPSKKPARSTWTSSEWLAEAEECKRLMRIWERGDRPAEATACRRAAEKAEGIGQELRRMGN